MNIVILDGYTTNPGDLNWDAMKSLGGFTHHDRTPPERIVSRAAGAEIIIVNKTLITREVIAALPRLRYIGLLSTGVNVVDLAAARERGIIVTNVPAYSTPSVVQLTFALLLELTQHVGYHSQTVRKGQWTASADFCYWDYPLVELAGLTMGIVGFGRIGQAVSKVALAFGMHVLAHGPRLTATNHAGVDVTSMDDLLRRSDVVSLHCPLTEQTRGLINTEALAKMKPSAYLLNTSRGPLVDQHALAEALTSGRLAGAGLDVLSAEPPPADNPLLQAPNCIITPHIAWGTRAARSRLIDVATANVQAFLDGRPANVVS